MPETNLNTGNPTKYASFDGALRTLIAKIIRSGTKKRPQIAEEMSALLGFRVTAFMLDGFTSPCKKASRFPASFIAAFCQVVADDRLQRFAAGERLSKMIKLGESVAEMLAEDKIKSRKVRKS